MSSLNLHNYNSPRSAAFSFGLADASKLRDIPGEVSITALQLSSGYIDSGHVIQAYAFACQLVKKGFIYPINAFFKYGI